MATPEDYRRDAKYKFDSARGTMLAPIGGQAVVMRGPEAVGPIREGSPSDDEAKPTIAGMVSRSGDTAWLPNSWLQAIAENDDVILKREGGQGLALYDRLLDDDAAASAMQQRRLAITSKDWEVAPGDDKDPRSVLAADEFRQMLKEIDFDRVTGGLHWAVWFGYGVGEGMYDMRVYKGRNIVWLTDIIIPDRRWFGFTMEGELRLVSTPYAGITGQQLPPNKFVSLRTGATHDFAFYGLGLAHWCYWPIFFKRAALQFWALYLEKFGMPTVAIEFPAAEKDDARAKSDRLAAAVAVGQDRAVLVPEGTLSNNMLQLIEAERSGAGSSSYKDFVGEQNDAIRCVVLGQPGTSSRMATGLGSGQSDVQDDVKDEIVKADSDLISAALGRTFAKWLTRWNHGPDVAPPTVFRVLDDPEDLGAVATRDATLDGIGIKRTEDSVKEVYGDGYELDRLSEADKADNAAKLAQAKAVPGQPPVAANENGDRAKIAKAKLTFDVGDTAPLYVSRKLLNTADLIAWAKSQGFESPVPAAVMHVTVLYSRTPVDWFDMGAPWQSNEDGTLNVAPGGPRAVCALGDDGAIVLRFYSPDIQYRHDSMVERGASHDFDEYAPHVTFTYDGASVDLAKVVPYAGELRFGPETFEPIKASSTDPATYAFSAADEQAIDRLISKLTEEADPVFEAMGEVLRQNLQGVTTIEGARIAILGAMEQLPVDRLARLTALPMLAERAGAAIGAEEEVTA